MKRLFTIIALALCVSFVGLSQSKKPRLINDVTEIEKTDVSVKTKDGTIYDCQDCLYWIYMFNTRILFFEKFAQKENIDDVDLFTFNAHYNAIKANTSKWEKHIDENHRNFKGEKYISIKCDLNIKALSAARKANERFLK
jgi:hypothetical protein